MSAKSNRISPTPSCFILPSRRRRGWCVSVSTNDHQTQSRRYKWDNVEEEYTKIARSLLSYNANNAVTSIIHKNPDETQIVQHSYTCDSTNNIVEYLNSIDGNTEYNYDYLGQLISADYANQTDESYIYDSNGNRITANGSNYTTGDNNELTSDGNYTYTYDAEGNRISKTNTANTERELYTWDYRNRLTSVTKQTFNTETQMWETVQVIEYTYDYNNIWIRKVVGENKTIFIPENYQTAVQIDNGATTTHHYLWTPNQQDKLLADTTTDGILWSLTDHLGTIRDIIGSENAHLIYDAFGNLISGTNPLLFGYTGKAFDVSTNLQNNINRWYDATIGRWLSTDPIGFEGNDTNLYRYVGNSTISFWDFSGQKQDLLIRARNEKLARIRADKGRKTPGLRDKDCETISIVIELPDPRSGNVGHSGIGIGNEFYDFGPLNEYPIPSTLSEYWEAPEVPGSQFWDTSGETKMSDIPKIARDIKNEEYNNGQLVIFVVFRISVCKSHAQKIKNYWEHLYQKIEDGTAVYCINKLHCTSSVLNSYSDSFSLMSPLVSPSTLLDMLADNEMFFHTCGENKGKPAKIHIYS